MEQPDRIINEIHNLAELQGKKDTILDSVKNTNLTSKDINDIVQKFPSYMDKCNYLKTLSEKFVNRAADSSSRANDIIDIVSELKNYVESSKLESCKNGAIIKQKLLSDLQTIQNASHFIIRPQQEGDYEQYSYVEEPIIPRGGKRNKKKRTIAAKRKNKRSKNRYTYKRKSK